MTPLWREANTHGLLLWNARPFTRGDLVSNFVNISLYYFSCVYSKNVIANIIIVKEMKDLFTIEKCQDMGQTLH